MTDITSENKEDKKNLRVGCLAIFVLLIAFVAWIAFGDHTSKPDGLGAFIASQNFVKQELKAPSTAKFPTYDESMAVTNDGKRFKITSHVDAKNSFGATVRTRYICIVTHLKGDEWQLDTVQLLD